MINEAINKVYRKHTFYQSAIPTEKEDLIYLRPPPFINNSKTTNNIIHSLNQKLNIKITLIYTCNNSKDLFETKSCNNDDVRFFVVCM